MDKAILPIADSICLVTRTHGSTCTNRTLRIGGWLTDSITGMKPLEKRVRPLPFYSNSLGNEMSRLVVGYHIPRQLYSNRLTIKSSPEMGEVEPQDGVKRRTEAGVREDTRIRDDGTSYTVATGW